MSLIIEIIKLIVLTLAIVWAAKYILVTYLRKLAETLNLKPRTVGNIAGVSTSIPELLTVSFSAATGFISTGIFNVLSSNIINLVLYMFSIISNKNLKNIRNKAIVIDIILAIATIIIPILLLLSDMEVNVSIVPIFALLYLLFYYIDRNAHKLYLKHQDQKVYEEIKHETKFMKGKKRRTALYSAILIITMVVLFFIGNQLSEVLERLCIQFGLPEMLLGVLLGVTTSIPELITFFESQKHYNKKENLELGVIEATNNLLASNMLCLFVIQSIGIIIFSLTNST